jgi:hypothetical protein
LPELKLIWYDGGLTPNRTLGLPEGKSLNQVNVYVGTKGKIISANYGEGWEVLLDDYKKPPQSLPRVPDHPLGGGRHEMDWVRACKEDADSRKEASANFDYSGPLTEMVLMGNLAVRLQGLNRELEWDGEKMEFKNISPNEELNLIVSHVYEKVDNSPRFNTDRKKVNALEFTKEMVKHTYRDGWGW